MIMEDQVKGMIRPFVFITASLASACSMAIDEVVDVEIINAGSAVIYPADDFSWSKDPANAGRDFSIKPEDNQALTYYLPQSRAERESFSYVQGDKRCTFSFGHVEQVPMDPWATMPYSRWVKAEPAGYCHAFLIDVADHDDYVRNGGTRIKFIMR